MTSTSSVSSMTSVAFSRRSPSEGPNENWYHGKIDRAETEHLLREAGFGEGLFLIRHSTSSEGDYVLSVVHLGEVIHYQIRARGEDALFSLSEEQKVIHGLDQLVNYYKREPRSGLQHELKDFVPGALPPPGTKLHGTENLLHRAASQGDITVVTELLAAGYRNLTSKNQEGQTAVHLASFYGHQAVLEKLIQFKALVNVTDSEGYYPLHYACMNNNPDTVRCLLEIGKANPTNKNENTQWVPMHEAANKGHLDCVSMLLEFGAPSRPRTPKNETPEDLALAAGHRELATFLERYPVMHPETDITDWYHPNIDRNKALTYLNLNGGKDGTYLIRNSMKKKRFFVLSMMWRGKGHHFEIEKRGIYYLIDEGPYMQSLEHLVQHYSRFGDGLPVELRHPVPPPVNMGQQVSPSQQFSAPPTPASSRSQSKQLNTSLSAIEPLEPNTNDPPVIPPRIPARDRAAAYPSNLRPIITKEMYANNDTLRRVRHSKDNIPLVSLKLQARIGEGEFGAVYKGSYLPETGSVKDVAIKALGDKAVESEQTDAFMREANVMMNLDHQCVVQLLGISCGPPILMVLELVPLGSMLDYLLENPDSVCQSMEMPLWASQIACGMMYLQSKKFVHRDLAARNILLSSKFQTKISDFGLSRVVGEQNYYRASEGGRWPVRWYAPECMNFGTFSHASDVWSYGIVLWEMYTYGKQPYEGKNANEVMTYLEAGHRLPQPDGAANDVYDVMLECWSYVKEERPSWAELFQIFSANPEYMNIKELLMTQDFQQLGMQ